MDLVKAFTNGTEAYQITVKGDQENPLFKAVDIARILEISNVSDALKDYDEDEKTTLALTEGSRKVANFLTEPGLYRFILSSQKNKPFVKRFKKWVCQVITEIRLTGQYQLQKQVKEREAKLLEFQQEKEAIEARAKEAEAKAVAKTKAMEAEAKAAELEERIKTKKYEGVARDEFVYVMKESAELHNNKHKIGKTINISNRKSNFQTSHASHVEIVHQIPTSNAHMVEQVVHSLLRRYHHGKEFFNCELQHSINLIDFTSAVYDTLNGCYEFITREEIAAKLHECIDRINENKPLAPQKKSSNKKIKRNNPKQWMGVTGKDKQKKKLVDHFTEGIDYIVYSATVAEINKGRGRPKETILLTPDAFKKLAQMSDGRGKEVRDYFIAMERVVIKYMQMQNAFMTQQLLEAQLQLKQQTQALEAKEHELQAMNNELQKYVNKTYEEIETTGFIYLVKTDGGFKVGRTKNMDQRVGELQTGNAEDIEVLLAFPTSDPVVLEATVHKILDPYRRKSKREYFDCSPGYIAMTIELTGKFLDTMKSSYPCITRPEIMEKLGEKFGTVFQMDTGVNKKIKRNNPNVTRFIEDCCVFEATERVHWSNIWKAYQSWKTNNPDISGHFHGKVAFYNVIKPMLKSDSRVITKDTKIEGQKAPGVEKMGLKKIVF